MSTGEIFVMRFVSYASHGGERLGILLRDQIIDAQECARHRRLDTGAFSDLVKLIGPAFAKSWISTHYLTIRRLVPSTMHRRSLCARH